MQVVRRTALENTSGMHHNAEATRSRPGDIYRDAHDTKGNTMQKFYTTGDIVFTTQPNVQCVLSVQRNVLRFHPPGSCEPLEYTTTDFSGARWLFRAICTTLQAEDLSHNARCPDAVNTPEDPQAHEGTAESWQPVPAEPYFYINEIGTILSGPYLDDECDRLRRAFGNCFSTREEAYLARCKALGD